MNGEEDRGEKGRTWKHYPENLEKKERVGQMKEKIDKVEPEWVQPPELVFQQKSRKQSIILRNIMGQPYFL